MNKTPSIPAGRHCMQSDATSTRFTDLCASYIYKSVILAKIMYAATAWIGFVPQSDSGALMLSFSVESEVASALLTTFTELGQAADNKLFRTVLFNSNHVLHSLMPENSNVFHYHNLRLDFTIDFYLIALINLLTAILSIEYCMSTFIDSLAFCPCVLSRVLISEYSILHSCRQANNHPITDYHGIDLLKLC
jgi:hypothetical protein